MEKTSDVYKSLYHYTTWSGLLGIISSQSLWATHYKFLNDYSEIVLFRNKLVTLIIPHVRESYEKFLEEFPNKQQQINQNGGLDRIVQHDAEVVVDAQYHATGDEIYILSFCGEHKNSYINDNGLLSQWRGYSSGGGFAIVFDTLKLEQLFEVEARKYEYNAMHLSDVIYSNNEERLKTALSEDLSVVAEDVRELFSTENMSSRKNNLKGYREFVNCISRYKHCGFEEENEVRAVILPTVIDQEYLDLSMADGSTLKSEKDRKFRDKNGQMVPYIDLFNSAEIELPIKRIIVGPHKEKEARAAALRDMIRNTSTVPGVAPSQVTVKIVNIVKIHAYRGQYGIF